MTEDLYAVLGIRVLGNGVDDLSYRLGTKTVSFSNLSSSNGASDFYDGIHSEDLVRNPRRLTFRLLSRPTEPQGDVVSMVGYPLAKVPHPSDNLSYDPGFSLDTACSLRERFPSDLTTLFGRPFSGNMAPAIHILPGSINLEARSVIPGVTVEDPGINAALQAARRAFGDGSYTADQLVQRYVDESPVSIGDIKGKSRLQKITPFRHGLAYLLRKATPLSFGDIGRVIGNRDHSTAISSVRKIEQLIREAERR